MNIQRQQVQQSPNLTIGNIYFFKNSHLIPHSNDPELEFVDIVSITFVSQRFGEKNQTISMHHSKDQFLCPVKVWALIVKRLAITKVHLIAPKWTHTCPHKVH